MADVGDNAHAPDDVTCVIAEGNTGDGKRNYCARFGGQLHLVNGGVPIIEICFYLGRGFVHALVFVNQGDVLVEGLLHRVTRDLLHSPVEKSEAGFPIDRADSFVHGLDQSAIPFLKGSKLSGQGAIAQSVIEVADGDYALIAVGFDQGARDAQVLSIPGIDGDQSVDDALFKCDLGPSEVRGR